MGRLVRVAPKKRLRTARLARVLAVFGVRPQSEAELFGLELNLQLGIRLRAMAYNMALGLSGDEVGVEWAEAISGDEEEGRALIEEENFSRYLRRKREELGGGHV